MDKIKVDFTRDTKLGLQLCKHIWLGGITTTVRDGDYSPSDIDVYCQPCGKTFKLAMVQWY